MRLATYFEHTTGTGVLATADGQGQVDAAVYSRPHVMADGTIAFIMKDRLTRHNLQSNPHAAYLFKEAGKGYEGVRLFLTKIGDEQDEGKIKDLSRRTNEAEGEAHDRARHLVYFRINKVVPLTSRGRCPVGV